MSDTVYDFDAESIDGSSKALKEYEGQVLLIVNTASKCGFTPQYKGLEALYEKFRERGFAVLGFPCNQFGHQEPGDEGQISEFCELNFGVTFPLFSKVDVNGADSHPLYGYLKSAAPGLLGSEKIKWNFTKFLVGRDGKAIDRYAPQTSPESLEGAIESALEG